MQTDALDGLLEHLFQAHGYQTTRNAALEGRSGAVYGAPVLAELEQRVLIVERHGADDRVRPDTVNEFARVVADTGADLGVLVALGPIDDDAESTAPGQVLVWDRLQVARLVGDAHLAEAGGIELRGLTLRPDEPLATAEKDPLPGSLANVLPTAFQDSADAAGKEEIPVFEDAEDAHAPPTVPDRPDAFPEGPPGGPPVAPTGVWDLDASDETEQADDGQEPSGLPFDLDLFEALSDGSPLDAPAGQGAAPEASPPTPAPPASSAGDPDDPAGSDAATAEDFGLPFTPLGDTPSPDPRHGAGTPTLLPRLDAREAARSVQERLFQVTAAELVLQPVHVFDYECDLLIEGSLRYDTVRGRIEVHGTDRSVRDVDPFVVDPAKAKPLPPGLAADARERTLRVSPERAEEKARAHLIETHTRIVEIETGDPDADYAVTERKHVGPRPDQVRLEVLGTLQRPLWLLSGPNGSMVVDALDGKVAGEALRTPDPDIVMLD